MRACVREEHGERWGVCGGVREEWRMLELPESFVQGHPWGIACTFFILIFFLIKHAEKKNPSWQRGFFFFPLCLLFICRCTGGLFTLLKRMRDPRDTALHAKLLWKGLGEEKGRNFQAF